VAAASVAVMAPAPSGDAAGAVAPEATKVARLCHSPEQQPEPDGGKLVTLSHNATLPKWSFGRSSRFSSKSGEQFGCRSDPGLLTSEWRTDCRGQWGCSGKMPRIDGSLDRFTEPPERAAFPRAKLSNPTATLGQGTALLYTHSPQFSFGGGKSRVPESEHKSDHISIMAAASDSTKQGVENLFDNDRKMTMKDLKVKAEQMNSKQKKARLSRGFGTEPRLRQRGGALELPFSPGPAAYEVPRHHDRLAQWVPSSTVPWGKRTGSRSKCALNTASDVGPGDHVADQGFKPSRSAPVFGHPLRVRPEDYVPEPGTYESSSTLGKTSYSIGKGNRKDFSAGDGEIPGPGNYNPRHVVTDRESFRATFGGSTRVHESELVDPDEPPGPGAHSVCSQPWTVRKVKNPGLPKETKLKKVPGLGPDTPGPGTYQDLKSKGRGVSVSLPLRRHFEYIPGPSDYTPIYRLTREASQSVRSPGYGAPRNPPHQRTLTKAELIIGRLEGEIEEEMEASGVKVPPRKACMKFGGPSFTMRARRPMPGPTPDRFEMGDAMVGAASSLS